VDGHFGRVGGELEDAHTINPMENKCRNTLNTGFVIVLDRAMEERSASGKVPNINIQDATRKDAQVNLYKNYHSV
jgi:hypothetical protein